TREYQPIERLLSWGIFSGLRTADELSFDSRQPASQQAARDADGLLDNRFDRALELPGVQGYVDRAGAFDRVGDTALAEQRADLLVVQLERRRSGSRFARGAQLDLGHLGVVPERVKRLEPAWMGAPARRQHLLRRVQSIGEQWIGLGQLG